MSKAALARQMGDDYQARFFWLEACRLFQDHSKVERVAYEHTGFRAFDDVVVSYSEPIPSLVDNKLVSADYYQLKFHVDNTKSLGFESLIEPSAIGASAFSLLQRLHEAVNSYREPQARFTLISAATINPLNTLAQVVDTQDGSLRLSVLFDQKTTDASMMGTVRQSWRTHLKLTDNSDLHNVVNRLRIQSSFGSLDSLNSKLNDRLALVGLKPVEASSQVNPYDDFIRKLHRRGMTEFDRDILLDECRREGLWIGQPAAQSDRISIGIQSFSRFAEHLEDETEHFMSLVQHFDGRRIRDSSLWTDRVMPDVRGFLIRHVRRGKRYLLHLDAHASIALLAGSTIDTKSGIDLAIVQRGASGTSIWESSPNSSAIPVVLASELAANEGGTELAIAVGITKKIGVEVLNYVRAALPSVRSVLVIEPPGGPSQAAVLDGGHAFCIAENAVQLARGQLTGSPGIIHLFASAPNTVLFNFGRMSAVLGRIRFYEHHFGTGATGDYEPALFMSGI